MSTPFETDLPVDDLHISEVLETIKQDLYVRNI
jgi:hypothetical protein